MNNRTLTATLLGLSLAATALGQSMVLWDEAVDGTFSHDFENPTSLMPVQAGINSIIGTTEVVPTGPNWAGFPDFFLITVPPNMQVSSIALSLDKPNVWTWIGNPQFSTSLAWAENPSPGELLLQWGLTSLGSGNYGVYLDNHDQQSITSVASYRLDFVVIPEPNAWVLLLLSATGCFLQNRGRRTWRKARQ